jgi:hypothetical protein
MQSRMLHKEIPVERDKKEYPPSAIEDG